MSIEPYRGLGPVHDQDGRPLDQILLLGLSATGYHGVFAHERRDGQLFVADVVLHLDLRPAAAGDDLAATVSYAGVAEEVVAVLVGEPADLVETVAERVAAAVLRHETVVAVDVAVHKPHAPVTVPIDDVVVALRRDRTRLPVAALPADRASAPRVTDTRHSGPFLPPAYLAAPGPLPDLAGPGPEAGAPTPFGADGVADPLDVPPAAPVEAVLSLGSNLGAPEATMRRAVREIGEIPGIEVVRISPLARTAPVGNLDQPDFLNAVLIVRTTLAPRALLRVCQQVEARHGRVRELQWGPRTLDIDIVVFGDVLAVDGDLELPHPRASQRAFVLQPWAQIAPHAVLPGLGGGPVAALAATAPDRDGIRWMALDWWRDPFDVEVLPIASSLSVPISVPPVSPFPASAPPSVPSVDRGASSGPTPITYQP